MATTVCSKSMTMRVWESDDSVPIQWSWTPAQIDAAGNRDLGPLTAGKYRIYYGVPLGGGPPFVPPTSGNANNRYWPTAFPDPFAYSVGGGSVFTLSRVGGASWAGDAYLPPPPPVGADITAVINNTLALNPLEEFDLEAGENLIVNCSSPSGGFDGGSSSIFFFVHKIGQP